MKREKTYEEKVADIKKYLKEKEEEVEKNKVSVVRKKTITNPLKEEKVNVTEATKTKSSQDRPPMKTINKETLKINEVEEKKKSTTKEKEDKIQFDESFNEFFNSIKLDTNKKDNDKKIENKKEAKAKEEKKPTNKKKNESKKNTKKKKSNKINIILLLMILICPLIITLSVISTHSTYLIRKPFNYIMFGLSGLLLIGIISFTILKLTSKKKKFKKLKYILTVFSICLVDTLLMILIIKFNWWKKIDIILENKKLFVILFLVLFLILIILLIIKKIKHFIFKLGTKNMLTTVLMTIYVLCYVNGLVLLYGPNKEIKEWLITTAMQTMHHQYFCKWFYNNDDIEYVLSQNYVLESGESTNPDLIKKNQEEVVVYENEYEEAVLKKEHKNDLYKIIELEVNDCKGYLAVIYDPKTVHVAVTNRLGVSGQYVTTMAKDRNAVLAINGGGFWDPGNTSAGGTPTGITISDGKIVTNGEYGYNSQGGGIIGFDSQGVFYLLKNTTAQQAINMGITDAVTWGPFLIVNGEPSFIKGNGGWGYAARTAIGQRADGIVLFLTVDSNATRTKGADMVDLTEIMQKYGAINAANLDGGTSTVMVMPQKTALKYNPDCNDDYCTINDPIDGGLRHMTRAIADAFVVVPNE